MPVTYEYKCPECNQVTETYYSEIYCNLHDEPIEMKRVYNIGGIVFKGKGFYKTDKEGN